MIRGVVGCLVGGALLGALAASGQSSIGDVRTGDTRIGDIRTGDMTQSANTHVYVGRDDSRPGRTGPGRAGLSLHGAFIPKFSATVETDWGNEDIDMKRAMAGGASLIFKLGEVGRFELGADYIPLKLDQDMGGDSIKIRLIPVTASLRLGIPAGDHFYLYGAGGVGYSFNEIRFEDLWGTEKETGGGLALFAGGGAEVALNHHISLRAEVRQFWHKWDFDEDVDIKLNHLQTRASIIFWL